MNLKSITPTNQFNLKSVQKRKKHVAAARNIFSQVKRNVVGCSALHMFTVFLFRDFKSRLHGKNG